MQERGIIIAPELKDIRMVSLYPGNARRERRAKDRKAFKRVKNKKLWQQEQTKKNKYTTLPVSATTK